MRWALCTASMLLVATGVAAQPCEFKSAEVKASETCLALFGGEPVTIANRKDRLEHLCGLQRRGKTTLRVQRKADWLEPLEVRYPGVDLEATVHGQDCEAVAIVQLSKAVLPESCTPGRYAVAVDHALGVSRRIIGITPGIVLMESNGTLVYLRTATAIPPKWEMTGCGAKVKSKKRKR